MGSSDFRLNAQVRQILVRHWVEIDSLTAYAINGTVYIKGYLQYRAAKRAALGEVTTDFLEKLEAELRVLKEMKKVRWQLENWEKGDEGWLRQGGESGKRPPPAPRSQE